MVKIMTILNIFNRIYMLNLAVPDPSFRMGAIVRSISAPSRRGADTKSSNTPLELRSGHARLMHTSYSYIEVRLKS